MRFFVVFSLIIVVFAFAFVRTQFRHSKLSHLDWEELIARIEPVPVTGISRIATDYLRPTKGQIHIEPDELWQLIGGVDGLRRMWANSKILVALASYTQRWNFDEGVIVAERMRGDAVTLRRALVKTSLGLVLQRYKVLGPFNVQEAASSYYLMRERLLVLYETSHSGRYSTLANAV